LLTPSTAARRELEGRTQRGRIHSGVSFTEVVKDADDDQWLVLLFETSHWRLLVQHEDSTPRVRLLLSKDECELLKRTSNGRASDPTGGTIPDFDLFVDLCQTQTEAEELRYRGLQGTQTSSH
jgi:hypothetical protein